MKASLTVSPGRGVHDYEFQGQGEVGRVTAFDTFQGPSPGLVHPGGRGRAWGLEILEGQRGGNLAPRRWWVPLHTLLGGVGAVSSEVASCACSPCGRGLDGLVVEVRRVDRGLQWL